MANELRLRHTATGATITALIWSGASRWNGTSLVLPSTIADAAWGTGSVACAELQTSDTTRTAYYQGTMPAIAVAGAPIPIDVYFFEGTPTPGQAAIGQQSFFWNGSQVVVPPNTSAGNVTIGGYASGQDPAALLASAFDGVRDLLEADRVIDTTVIPWALVLIKRGSGALGSPGAVELLRQRLYDVAGGNVTNTATVLGRSLT